MTGRPGAQPPPVCMEFDWRLSTTISGRMYTESLSLSGSFTPCRHLRPSLGLEHRPIVV